jgi:chemotaxis protein histidine kinase CheA/CheY-like chemotaxis protein
MAVTTDTPAPELEIGPLSWVKGEIDVALAEARERLDSYASAHDAADLKRAHSALHQVTGALAMVGLAAAKRFGEELESAVGTVATTQGQALTDTTQAIKRGGHALSSYLETLLGGEPDRPLMLLKPFLELSRVQGKTGASEGDLFYPSLSAPIALPTRDRNGLDDSVKLKAVTHQRGLYQQSLLKVMRNLDTAEALKAMHAAVVTVESLQTESAPRAFWNAAVAFLESLVFGGAEINVAAKQLFAKIDQQIKSLIDGNWALNERLFRDVLLFVGRSRPVTARIAQVRETYRLERLLSLPEMPRGVDIADGQKDLVRELRELVGVQKDTWLKYTSGQRGAIDPFADQSRVLLDKCNQQANQDLSIVVAVLNEVAPHLKSRQIPPSEAQSLEVATALLFVETALENYFRLGADFSRQARTVAQRVRAALAGERLPAIEAGEGLLDQSTRKAQERLLIFQVGQEVLANLSAIEAALDAYFRDPSKRSELGQLGSQFAQVQGALMIMELRDASDLNLALMKRVQAIAADTAPLAHSEAELMADGLSALSLYVASVQKGESNPGAVLMSALLKFGLREPVVAKPIEMAAPTPESREMDAALAQIQAAYGAEGALDALTQGEATLITRPALPEVQFLATTHPPAETVVRTPPVPPKLTPATADLALTPAQAEAPTLRLQTVPDTPPAPVAPLMPAVTLTDAPPPVDDELLGIFLEEAAEVVVTIGDNLALLREKAHDREALTVIRRGFHTLKGSGRMVGLMDLGDVAWQCEQVLNKWLAEERSATPELCEFIEQSQHSFAGWILALQDSGHAAIDGSAIAVMAEYIKSGAESRLPTAPEDLPESVPTLTTETQIPAALVESLPFTLEPAPAFEIVTLETPIAPLEVAPERASDVTIAPAFAEFVAPVAVAPPEPIVEAAPPPAEYSSDHFGESDEEPDVLIGTVAIQPTFLSIYLGEAETHIATLEREMQALEDNRFAPVSHAFMRAAHTLTSTSRTTGFTMVSDVAYPLEKWLQDAMEFRPEMTAHRLTVTRDAVTACGEMVRSIGRLQAPDSHPAVATALVALREEFAELRKSATGVNEKIASITQQLMALSDEEDLAPTRDTRSPFDRTADLRPSSVLMEAAAAEFVPETPAPPAPVIVPEPAAMVMAVQPVTPIATEPELADDPIMAAMFDIGGKRAETPTRVKAEAPAETTQPAEAPAFDLGLPIAAAATAVTAATATAITAATPASMFDWGSTAATPEAELAALAPVEDFAPVESLVTLAPVTPVAALEALTPIEPADAVAPIEPFTPIEPLAAVAPFAPVAAIAPAAVPAPIAAVPPDPIEKPAPITAMESIDPKAWFAEPTPPVSPAVPSVTPAFAWSDSVLDPALPLDTPLAFEAEPTPVIETAQTPLASETVTPLTPYTSIETPVAAPAEKPSEAVPTLEDALFAGVAPAVESVAPIPTFSAPEPEPEPVVPPSAPTPAPVTDWSAWGLGAAATLGAASLGAAALGTSPKVDTEPLFTPAVPVPVQENREPVLTDAAAPAEIPAPMAFVESLKGPTETTVTRRPVSESTQRLATIPDDAPYDAPTEPALLEVGKDRRVIRDDVDADLLPVFLEEARELLPQAGESLRAWRQKHDNLAAAGELQRHLHTLKGSARMTGLMRLGELAHVIETKVLAMGVAKALVNPDFDEVQDKLDRFNISLERVSAGQDYQPLDAEVPVAAELDQYDKPAVLATIAAQRDAVAAPADRDRQALLRVPAESIDRFVNQAGELSIARSRVEGELISFKRALTDLTENVARMRGQLREIEIAAETQIQSSMREKESRGERFDPLEFDRFSRLQELTRFMAESVNDLITLQLGLQKNIDESDAALLQQMRLNRDLQQGLMSVRLVPLTNLSDRFYRVVRQTAKELGKKANLELRGVRVELDRSVLEKITAPFEHLLRNAIAHGIESPERRNAASKPEIGEIGIDAAQIGNEVVLTVTDDGAGLNFTRIREKAIEAGLLDPNTHVNEAQLAQFIFMPGFSTASEITQISGRGVGMDVVRNDITALGGRIEIGSVPGKGTKFTITLPLTLAVTQAVLMRAGGTVYAVPSVTVEQAQEYKANGYADVLARGEIRFKDNHYPLRSLLPLLGQIDTPTPQRNIPVLLLRSGAQRAAIRIDEIIGNREVVVKTIGPQLARLPGIAGATVMGNGQVVLILNPVQLVHREVAVVTSREQAPIAPAPVDLEPSLTISESSGMPLVMVVDDSLTVRKITSRMLTREGFEVVTAKDGVDALQQLQDTRPDVILSDIEMPRMDGFELLRNIRADEGLRSIPVIMITSRTADKHRAHAIELGVNEYLGKPYQEDQLLAMVRQYTGANVSYAAM